MKSALTCALFCCGVAARTLSFAAEPANALPLGYSPHNMDKTADPRQDFYQYATGNWLKHTEIPAADPDYSGFSKLQHNLNQQLLTIIRQADTTPAAQRTPTQQQIGDFYHAAMDVKQLDSLGLAPLKTDLARLNTFASGKVDLGNLLAEVQVNYGVSPLLNAAVGPDPKNSHMNVLYLVGGIRALSRDEYVSPESQSIRDLYKAHIASMFETLGEAPAQAMADAAVVLSIETDLAKAELTAIQKRDPAITNNKLTFAQAQALIPSIDLRHFLKGLGAQAPDTMQVQDLKGLQAVQQMVAQRTADELQTLMRWHVLSLSASALGQPWYGLDEAFGRKRQGLTASEPREQQVTRSIATLLFHPISKLYVETYFPQQTRQDISQMVAHIKDAFAERIKVNTWLDDPTRKAALEKLSKLDVAVGYPERWIDFSQVKIKPDDHFGNIRRIGQFFRQREFEQLGKPVVIERFAAPNQTTPIAVNAAYNPQYNNVDITAAIVQPPFYVPTADAAVNYCTIGAVIGHELTHGFDSMGRQFGPAGNLKDWWTPQATAEFKKRTDVLVDQYSQFEILPGLMHNGALTITENIADLGGISLAHAALQKHLSNHSLPEIDGLNSDQRCFVAWSQMWSYKARPERLRVLVTTDYHSITFIRAVAPLLHLDAFHRAFATQPGDAMWREPEKRVTIW